MRTDPKEFEGSTPQPLAFGDKAFSELVSRGSSNVVSYVGVALTPADKSLQGIAKFYLLGETSQIFSNVSAIGEERKTLRQAVKNLWKVYRYNQHYIGYLAGGVSEEEFNAAVEKFAQAPEFFTPDELKRATSALVPIMEDEELTAKDLAVVLNADENQLELAIQA
ncbi:MAG: hypothetical protein Q7S40_06375 [Opitutaceae bacterium]|nr:hypothetical protein [Opitutaceae bacterium]